MQVRQSECDVRCQNRRRLRLRTSHFALCTLVAAALVSGCNPTGSFRLPEWMDPFPRDDPKVDYTSPEGSYELRNGQMVPVMSAPAYGGDFEGAMQLFNQKDYAKAEPIFRKIADNQKNTLQVLEGARWFQAECFYKQGLYPDAAERYLQLLHTFPSAAHGEQCRKKLFDIANYWLDETRDQMEQAREVREGKRWFTTPIAPVHFEDSKPLLDIEGHALRMLEAVYMTNPHGELADKALFYLGSVKFYREDYREADHYFYTLVKTRPKSEHAAKALELSIICKEICTGGPDYDGRRLQEARDLITMARHAYPELSRGNEQFLTKQMVAINKLEAEKDFNTARFWDRTGHPGSAYFCYEIVKRRYPGTSYAEKAEQRMNELRAKAEQEQQKLAAAAQAAGTPAPGAPAGPAPQPRSTLPGPEAGPQPRTLPPGMTDGGPR
jgi:TolA-binding protein